MDDKSRQEFNQRQNFLQLFDQPNPDFSSFTQVPQLEAFVSANQDEIGNLKKHTDVTNRIMNQFIKPTHDNIMKGLDSINVDGETQKIIMREKTQTEIFDVINQRFGNQFTDFEDKVGKVYQSLTKLRQMAQALNAKGCPLNGRQGLDNLTSSLSFFVVSFLLFKKSKFPIEKFKNPKSL